MTNIRPKCPHFLLIFFETNDPRKGSPSQDCTKAFQLLPPLHSTPPFPACQWRQKELDDPGNQDHLWASAWSSWATDLQTVDRNSSHQGPKYIISASWPSTTLLCLNPALISIFIYLSKQLLFWWESPLLLYTEYKESPFVFRTLCQACYHLPFTS